MIYDFQRWSAPPALMLLCLLLVFNSKVDCAPNSVQFVELFAGVGEISKACRARGMIGSSHDLSYSAHYDLCERSGFLHHGCARCFYIVDYEHTSTVHINIYEYK